MSDFKQGAQCGDGVAAHGEAMGFKQGGRVKKVRDTGNVPARKGSDQQEIEAGGTPKLKPGFKRGGKTSKKMRGGRAHGRGHNPEPMYGKK